MVEQKLKRRARGIAALLLCLSALCAAQVSDKISSVTVGQPHAGEPLPFQADLINVSAIDRVVLAYRSFGQSEYKQLEMVISANTASVSVPANDLLPPILEYYFIIYKRGVAQPETYPMENAVEHPFKAELLAPSETSNDDAILILTPDPSENIEPEDFFISFSLLRTDSSIDRQATKTFLDGVDVSANQVFKNDLVIVHPPQQLAATANDHHIIKIELFDKQGSVAHSKSWEFHSSGTASSVVANVPSQWKYGASLQAETRNENISSVVTPFNRLTLTTHGEYNDLKILGKLYVTNEEKNDRQPQDRFFLGAELPWLKVGLGDNYPVFPDYIMNGKRVRGFEGNLLLGIFNLDATQGTIVRHIESDTVKTFPLDSLTVEQSRDPNAAYGVYNPSTQRWAKFQYGTFDRTLFAIRPSFGKNTEAHIGFSYLKSTDDMSSIRFGSMPKENLVVGTDMYVPFDNHHIEFNAQAAMSATNEDITNGTFTDQQIDSIYSDYSQARRDNIRRLRDIFSRFITVNEHLVPLNMTNLPTLAYEGSASFNYVNNFLKFSYVRRGDKFESFGQSFLQTDIQGYNINDRLQLLRNELILAGGLEHLHDNTAETKPATTTSITGNFSVSYFPHTEVPSMTFGYVRASNDNSLPNDSTYGIDDMTNRFFVQLGKQFIFGPTHRATLSISTSTRDDQSVRNKDSRNTSFSLSNSSSFTIPLQTLFSLTTTSSTFSGSSLGTDTSITYTTLFFNAQYRFAENTTNVSASISPTFGDIARTLIDARAQYYITHSLSLLAQMSLYFNKNSTNDAIWSLILRADI